MNKKGLSEMVGYVLLIVIAVSLSVIVYSWIKGQLPGETEECPEGVSLIISDYHCLTDNRGEILKLELENKGLFNIDGFYIRGAETLEDLPIILVKPVASLGDVDYIPFPRDEPLEPGKNITIEFYWEYTGEYGKLAKIEVEPFRTEGNQHVLCKNKVVGLEIRCL